MVVQMVVPLGIGLLRRAAKACKLANDVFVFRPHFLRPFEGFAVKTRRHHVFAHGAYHGFYVKLQAWPA